MKRCHFLLLFVFSLYPLIAGCAADPLLRAAETGNSAKLNELVHQGVPVDQRGGSMDETALMIAARHGNLGMVKTLLEAGADINARSKYNDTPLTAATYFCHPNVAFFLIEHGADVNAKNSGFGSSPIMLATDCNDIEVMRALIKRNANVNESNKAGATALTSAAVKGRLEGAKLLLEAGADVNHSNLKVGSPLYEAAQQGNDAIVTLLLEKGADVNYQSKYNGWTPLMIAVAEKHESTASLLIKAGANVNLANDKGRTALMFSSWYGSLPITELLLKSGANPNIVPNDENGTTALMAAASKGYKQVVEILLRYNADPNLKDKNNKTALSYATSDTKKILIDAGGKI